jgi:hypothetical protein
MSWRRILLLSCAIIALLAIATWAALVRGDAATAIVRRELQALFRTPADLASATVDLGKGRATLRDLRLGAASDGLEVACAGIDVDAGFGAGGALVGLHAVHVRGLRVALGPRLPDVAALLREAPRLDGAATPATGLAVPAILVADGAVRWTAADGAAPVELVDLALSLRPRGDGPGMALRMDARLADPAIPLRVVGVVDPATGALDVEAALGATRVDQALLARVAALLGVELPAIEAGGELRTLALRAQRAPGAADLRLSAHADLARVHARGDAIPTIVTDAAVAAQWSTDAGGRASLQLVQRTDRGALDVVAHGRFDGEEPHFDVRLHGEGLRIDREVVRALGLFEAGRNVVAALEPTAGIGDLELFIENPHKRGGATDLDLRLRDVAVTYRGFGTGERRVGFPLPMANARGRVRLRDRVLLLDDIHSAIAERAGGGVVRVSGRVDTIRPSGEDASVDIAAEGVAFTPDLRAALGTLLRDDGALYDKFAPEGRADVRVAVRPRSELPGGWAVDIQLADAAMRWAGFPYRLDRLRGSVRARQDGVRFDLGGAHGAGSLRMRGFLPLEDEAWRQRGFDASVEVAGLAIDDDLRAAVAMLAPELGDPWRRSEATGRIDGHVAVWRDTPDEPLAHESALTLQGVELALPAAPWRAHGLAGGIRIEGVGGGTRVDFDGVRGELRHPAGPPSQLALLGALVLGGGELSAGGEDLAFVVRGLALDDQLGASLEELGALGVGTWRQLRPSGQVDLVCRHRRAGARVEPLQLSVALRGVRSDAPILPRPVERLTGELRIDGGELRFDELHGTLGGAAVTAADGLVRARPAPDLRTEIAFTVRAAGVPIDDGFANLFAGPLQQAVLRRQLLGTADVEDLRLGFAVPTAASTLPLSTTLAGRLRLHGLDVTLGAGADSLVVEGIRGVVELAPSTIAGDGGGLRGALRGVALRVFGQPLEAIDAEFTADAAAIAIAGLDARLHGGFVRSGAEGQPAVRFVLPGDAEPDGSLQTNLAFTDVDVYGFLAATGWSKPTYSGLASGAVRVKRLAGADIVGAVGDGELRIVRADLGVVPLFTAIYAQLPAADRPRFDALDLAWQVADGAATFPRLEVRSSLLAARGAGRLDFDGYLDVELTLANLLGDSADPLVMPLLSYLAQNIVTFHLHGYLGDLRAEKRWLIEAPPMRRGVAPVPPPPAGAPQPGF